MLGAALYSGLYGTFKVHNVKSKDLKILRPRRVSFDVLLIRLTPTCYHRN